MSSQSVFPPTLSYVSFVITITSFVITVLNLVALYADAVATIRAAPTEIRDSLGNLRSQICEEREALRRQTRERRDWDLRHPSRRSRHHHQHRGSRNSRRSPLPPGVVEAGIAPPVGSPPTFDEHTLALHYQTLRDLWRQFRALERPFLVSSGLRAEAIRHGDQWGVDDMADEKVRADIEAAGGEPSPPSWSDWSAFYRCDFVHRFIWWQSKKDVIGLADKLQRLMIMRMEREVTQTRLMVRQLSEGGMDPGSWGDGRDGGGGGGRGGAGGGNGGDGGLRRRASRSRRGGGPGDPAAETWSSSSDDKTGPSTRDGGHLRRRGQDIIVETIPSRPRTEYDTRRSWDGPREGNYTIVDIPPRSDYARGRRSQSRSRYDRRQA